jgi:hypothetical protein
MSAAGTRKRKATILRVRVRRVSRQATLKFAHDLPDSHDFHLLVP